MNCRQCRKELTARITGRPRLYCSAACRQRAFRVRRLNEAAALPGELDALAAELRDNAEAIRFLARGWSPPEPGPSLAELIQDTADVAERLRELGDDLP